MKGEPDGVERAQVFSDGSGTESFLTCVEIGGHGVRDGVGLYVGVADVFETKRSVALTDKKEDGRALPRAGVEDGVPDCCCVAKCFSRLEDGVD